MLMRNAKKEFSVPVSSNSSSSNNSGEMRHATPAFLEKLFDILDENSPYSHLISWQPDGASFIIKKVHEFSETVLPKYFKHSNIQSYIRQLNMYGFSKTRHDSTHREFTHKMFRKGRRDLLPLIKRKSQQHPTPLPVPSAHSIEATSALLDYDVLKVSDGLQSLQEIDMSRIHFTNTSPLPLPSAPSSLRPVPLASSPSLPPEERIAYLEKQVEILSSLYYNLANKHNLLCDTLQMLQEEEGDEGGEGEEGEEGEGELIGEGVEDSKLVDSMNIHKYLPGESDHLEQGEEGEYKTDDSSAITRTVSDRAESLSLSPEEKVTEIRGESGRGEGLRRMSSINEFTDSSNTLRALITTSNANTNTSFAYAADVPLASTFNPLLPAKRPSIPLHPPAIHTICSLDSTHPPYTKRPRPSFNPLTLVNYSHFKTSENDLKELLTPKSTSSAAYPAIPTPSLPTHPAPGSSLVGGLDMISLAANWLDTRDQTHNSGGKDSAVDYGQVLLQRKGNNNNKDIRGLSLKKAYSYGPESYGKI